MISVCTANFNKSLYLVNFLDSIVRYEGEHVSEIVIVDDCSTDNSCEVIEQRRQNNKKFSVKLIKNEINKGPGPSYDTSVRNATHDFIMIMDSDDFIIESSIPQKLDYLNNHKECEVVYGNGRMYNDKKKLYTTDSLNDTFFNSIFSQSLPAIKKYFQTSVSNLYVPGCLIRRSFLINTLGGFDHATRSNDRVLNIKIFKYITNKNQISYCSIACFAYRIGDTNITSNYQNMEKLMLEVASKYGEESYKDILISNIFFTIAMNAIKNGNKKTGLSYYWKSKQYNFSFKKFIGFTLSYLLPYRLINSQFLKKKVQKIYIILTS